MPNSFDAQYERIKLVLGVRTQVEVAEALGIRQSSISDAKRRRSTPNAWKMALFRLRGVNPMWIESGQGPVQVDVDGENGEPVVLPVFSLATTSQAPFLEQKEARCRVCGCTENRACDGGCSWVEPDLCSACVDKELKLAAFLSECCVVGPGLRASSSKLYTRFADWLHPAPEMSIRAFIKAMKAQGYTHTRSGGAYYWEGIGLQAGQVNEAG